MAVFDDDRLSQMLELKPFHDWVNPVLYGETKVITPETSFREFEEVQGGVIVRDREIQREVALDKGLHISGVSGDSIRVTGLAHSSVWEKSVETAELLKSQAAEHNRIEKANVPSDVQDILHDQAQMRREGGGNKVWEIDASFTQEELVRLGLAQESRQVVTTGETFVPYPPPPAPYDHAKATKEVADALKHEAVNVYGDMGVFAPYLSPTWWMFLEELEAAMTEFSDIKEAMESLRTTMFERLPIEPGADLDSETQHLMGARYELPIFGGEIIHRDAMLEQIENPLAWIDFLAGFPYGDCEMLTLAGEVTTKEEEWPSYPDKDSMPVPPVPNEFFDEETYTEPKTAHNLNWLESDRVDAFADGISGEPTPDSPNWWLRMNLTGDEKYPYPGEFLGLGVRIFPNLTWGSQKRSPFLYGGHWIDTAFITSGSAKIVEKNAGGYYTCTLDWRKMKSVKVFPSDFAEYKVGDRVTILKDIKTTKTSQLWKDEDCFKFDEEVWRIVPLTYYGHGFADE